MPGGNTMFSQIFEEFIAIANSAVFGSAISALLLKLGEVYRRRFGSDRDIYFTLHQSIVGNLVVPASSQAFRFQIFSGEHVMHVRSIQNEIGDSNISR